MTEVQPDFSEAPYPTKYEKSHRRLGWVVRFLWGLEVHNRDYLPPKGPYILVPNHRSIFDPFITAIAVNRAMSFMAKKEIWEENKYIKTGLTRYMQDRGAYPVDRGGQVRDSMEKTTEIIRNNGVAVVYAEGTAKKKGRQLHEILPGAAHFALKAAQEDIECPILPFGLTTDSLWPHRNMQAVVGEPIFGDLVGQSLGAAKKELSEKLGVSLQNAVDQAYDLRKPRVLPRSKSQ